MQRIGNLLPRTGNVLDSVGAHHFIKNESLQKWLVHLVGKACN